jgi:large subunit ribosomal protein L18
MIVRKRRRREGKTDYRKRLKLLESNRPRLVVRKTNRYIIAQIVLSKEARDRVVVGATTKKLAEFNWSYGFKNVPSAYLLGLLVGKMAKERGINEAILDVGLNRVTRGNRIFSVLAGAIKFLNIPYGKDILPSQERIYGKHINEQIEKKVKEIEEKIMKK